LRKSSQECKDPGKEGGWKCFQEWKEEEKSSRNVRRIEKEFPGK
jgi:hypothetical protein